MIKHFKWSCTNKNTKPCVSMILRKEITKRSNLKNQAINQANLPISKFYLINFLNQYARLKTKNVIKSNKMLLQN